MWRSSRGLTLIELLVVISIIGLLATIVLASISTVQKKARDARRIADIREIRDALEAYAIDNHHYPSIFGGPGSTYCSAITSAPVNWIPSTYMPSIPTDPLWSGSLPYSYQFCQNHASGSYDNQSYALWAALELGAGNAASGWSSGYRPTGYNYVVATFGPQ